MPISIRKGQEGGKFTAHPINIGEVFIRYYAAPLHTFTSCSEYLRPDYSGTGAKILE